MASQNDQNHYEAVIADLEAKRDEITRTIESLRHMAGLTASPQKSIGKRELKPVQPAVVEGDNPYSDMKIHDAAKVILAKSNKPMSALELVDAMEDGGLLLSGENKKNTVGSVLNRRQKQVGDIVSVKRGQWGLKEWYPDQSQNAQHDNQPEITESQTTAHALPGLTP